MTHMDEIRQNFHRIQADIRAALAKAGRGPDQVRLVAVTKNHPVEVVNDVVDCGVTDIGENRVQELLEKAPLVKGPVTFHMVGHLQRNKARKAVEAVHWIQSVDSERLADAVVQHAQALNRRVKVLVEVNTSGEASKTGCAPDAAVDLCHRVAASPAVDFRGLMTVGPLGADEARSRAAFAMLRELGTRCTQLTPRVELSMGMSDDFAWAIEEGATIVRIGTRLLGSRTPNRAVEGRTP